MHFVCFQNDFGKSTRVILLYFEKAEMQNVVISQIVANGEGWQPAPSPATPAGSIPSPSKSRKMCADKWIKIESPVKSGDDTKDTNAMAAFHMVCSACEDIIGQQQLVTPVFSTIRAEKNIAELSVVAHQDQEMFSEHTTLHAMDQGFKIAFVTGNSDLSGHDIETISEADPSGQALTDICQLALQIQVKTIPNSIHGLGCFEHVQHVESC